MMEGSGSGIRTVREEGKLFVSVIVPVYNGQKYLQECLRAIERQDYPNLEVILVNDCSTDGSMAIIESFAAESRFPVSFVNNSRNVGQGEARNIGLSKAEGDYAAFIDQDDVISPDYIRTLCGLAEHADGMKADIVISGYCRLDNRGRQSGRVRLVDCPWSKYMCIAPWGKLYRILFLRENRIRFAGLALGEDIFFNISAFAKTDRITVSSYCGYQWRINPNSFSNTEHRRLSKRVSMISLFNALLTIDDSNGILSEKTFEYFLIKTLTYDILHTAPSVSSASELENERELHQWMRNHYPGYLGNPFLRMRGPKGERLLTALIIRLYMWSYQAKLTPLLFRMVCHGS